MARLESIAKAGYYPTPPRIIEAVAEVLEVPYFQSTLTLCDPCCGEGDALARLAELLAGKRAGIKVKTYGAELSPERAQKAREKLDVVVQSDALKLYVQPREPFGLVYLNPPYGTVGGKRLEYEFLKLATALLAKDAPLVLVIPYYVAKGIADYWASWYHRTLCLKFPDPEFGEFKQVVLIGQKRYSRLLKPDEEEKRFLLLVASLNEEALKEEGEYRFGYAEPGRTEKARFFLETSEPPQVFMTTDVTKEDLERFAAQSGLFEEILSTNTLPDPTVPFQPLMSLRQGHLVQILVSGALNGKLRDREGNEIWVKGSVWKEFQEQEELHGSREGDRVTQVKVRRERFSYAVRYWTPEGGLKTVQL